MVVEAEVEEGVTSRALRPYETDLVKTGIRLVTIDRGHLTEIIVDSRVLPRLSHEAAGEGDLRATEETDTGRVRRHRGDIGTKGFHGTTHTDITCCTVEFILDELRVLVSLLCGYRCCTEQSSRHDQSIFRFHFADSFFRTPYYILSVATTEMTATETAATGMAATEAATAGEAAAGIAAAETATIGTGTKAAVIRRGVIVIRTVAEGAVAVAVARIGIVLTTISAAIAVTAIGPSGVPRTLACISA